MIARLLLLVWTSFFDRQCRTKFPLKSKKPPKSNWSCKFIQILAVSTLSLFSVGVGPP